MCLLVCEYSMVINATSMWYIKAAVFVYVVPICKKVAKNSEKKHNLHTFLHISSNLIPVQEI